MGDLLTEYGRDTAHVRSESVTVSDLAAMWLRDVAPGKLRPKTLANYTRAVEQYIDTAPFARLPVAKLTEAMVQSWQQRLSDSGLASSSVGTYAAILREVLSWGVRMRYLHRNPSAAVHAPKRARNEQPCLDAEGMKAVIAASRGSRLELPVLIAVGSGMRRGEIFALRWCDVELSSGVVRVTRNLSDRELAVNAPKTDKGWRTVRLAPFAVDALVAAHEFWHAKPEDFICRRADGRPIWPSNATAGLRRLLDKAGVQSARPWHTLRHSVLTLLADHMTPRDLQELAGHADVHTTMSYYVHAKEEAQQRGAAALAAAIELKSATDVRPNGAK